MKRIAAIVTCVDSIPVAEEAVENLKKHSTPELTDVIMLDNGSYDVVPQFQADYLIRFPNNRGGNSVFHRILPFLPEQYDILCFFHNDLMVVEEGWDARIAGAFDRDPLMACIGFVGSNEIDAAGGRGLGTTLSYMGYEYRTGWASPAEVHGRRSVGIEAAAVLDHCSMIFRRSMLEQLPAQDENDYHTPGHFYDRVLCCEIIKRGWHIATAGIKCDHFSGGIGMCKVPGEQKGLKNRDEFYKVWLGERGLPYDPEKLDLAIYQESERRYLGKWRDQMHFIPFKVMPNYNVVHTDPRYRP